MKTRIIIILTILTLCACDRVRDFNPPPTGIKIYKTNGDYFNYVNIWDNRHNSHNNTLFTHGFNYENNDTIIRYRWRLEQGYVADELEGWVTDYFTDITHKEAIKYKDRYNAEFPFDSIEKRIIDKDPFIEFYYDDILFFRVPEQIDEINEIIRKGELGKYLKKIK